MTKTRRKVAVENTNPIKIWLVNLTVTNWMRMLDVFENGAYILSPKPIEFSSNKNLTDEEITQIVNRINELRGPEKNFVALLVENEVIRYRNEKIKRLSTGINSGYF